jgi:hypothetical protein
MIAKEMITEIIDFLATLTPARVSRTSCPTTQAFV